MCFVCRSISYVQVNRPAAFARTLSTLLRRLIVVHVDARLADRRRRRGRRCWYVDIAVVEMTSHLVFVGVPVLGVIVIVGIFAVAVAVEFDAWRGTL